MRNESAAELAVRLSRASVKKFWNVYEEFDWPEAIDPDGWCMTPEYISIYGTELYDELSEEQRKKLSFYEIVNLFSLTLHGERPLVQGLAHQMYDRQGPESTEYIHHFLDEENKHMVMFGTFCNLYAGKVYPPKKLILPKQRKYEKGEEDVIFFIKALVVEELGDVYNVAMMRDNSILPIVKEINYVHHIDEARHIAYGRKALAEAFAEYSPKWRQETLDALREWLPNYLRASWADFYNPTVYADAGLDAPYEIRKAAMSHEACAASRQRISATLVNFFLDQGILLEAPAL